MSFQPLARAEMLGLYRNLLRGLKHFPSKKKNSLIQEVKRGDFILIAVDQIEFREHKNEKDIKKIETYTNEALQGLQSLSKYQNVKITGKDFAYEFGQ